MATPAELKLEVATPTGLVLQTEAEMVQAPSVNGEFGVLPGHLPLLAALQTGVLSWRIDGKEHVAAIAPGFVEAEPDKVLVLTENFALPADVDIDKAKAELADCKKRIAALHKAGEEGPELREVERSEEWAEALVQSHEIHNRP